MSKMGQELDRLLDENKYEMWEVLREITDYFHILRQVTDQTEHWPILERMDAVLAKIGGGI